MSSSQTPSLLSRLAFWRKPQPDAAASVNNGEPAVPAPPMSPHEAQTITLASVERMLNMMTNDRQQERRNVILRRLLLGLLPLIPIAFIVYSGHDRYAQKRDGLVAPVVLIDGVIGDENGSAKKVIPALDKAFNSSAQRVVVIIQTPGGSPADAERIRAAMLDLKSRTKKRLDVIIDGSGTSAGYMIALAADKIYAGRYSLVGSVGVIMQTWDASELANRNGVRQHTYQSGAAKALGNFMRAPTTEETAAGNALVSDIAKEFRNDVISMRGAKLKIDAKTLTTGQVWIGQQALDIGLIDGLATPEEFFTQQGIKPQEYSVESNSLRSLTRGIVGTAFEAVSSLAPSWK